MKPIYKSLVAATAAASLITVASVAVSSRQRTTTATTTTSTTVSAQRPGRVPPPSPTITLLTSPTHLMITANAGTQAARTLSVAYTGAGGFLHVVQDSTALAPDPTVTSLGNGQFTVTVRTSDVTPEGTYRGTVRLRLCAETPCVNVLASASVPYRLTLNWANVAEWETFQRDAGHTGHVPIVVNPARIAKKWEWQIPIPDPKGISGVATEAGRVFVSAAWHPLSLYALSEGDGTQIWMHDFGSVFALNPPAASNGRVYVATTGHEATALRVFRSSDGAYVWASPFSSQGSHVLAPTVRGGRVYTNGGYYGGGVYAYDTNDGTPSWSRFKGNNTLTTPAVDDSRVYFYDEDGLQVYDAVNGNSIASIADPYFPERWYDYAAAPVLGSRDNIIAFSGATYTSGGAESDEYVASRGLINFSVDNYMARWRTEKAYKTQPAVANGVIYAAANDSRSLDAISEATGQVLWSWSAGASDTTEFHRNVVVMKNLVFVSTEQALYAIDLATQKPVWSAPTPGAVAISGGGTLYVAEGAKRSNGRLIAYRLR